MISSLKNKLIRINFSNRGLAKVIIKPDDVASSTPNKNTVLNLAAALSNVKIERGSPVSFPSIADLVGVEYVGYIIEKERLDKNTEQWIRIGEYKIVGSESNSFTDTRVAYGESYRYRMKSILKYTKIEEVNSFDHLESVESVHDYEVKKIQESLERNKTVLDEINKFTGLGLTPKTSAGVVREFISILGNLSIQADAGSTNFFKDSSTVEDQDLRLLENLRVTNLSVLQKSSTSDLELKKMFNLALERYKQKIRKYKTCYFESYPTLNWTYVDIAESVPPPPPSAIKVVPCSPKKEVFVSWLVPANDQRDIQSYRIFKRKSLGEPWKIIGRFREYDVDSDGDVDPILRNNVDIPATTNAFIDRDVEFGEQYIYALACVDVHGIMSFLSAQIGVELNPNYDREKVEKPLRWVSGSGAKTSEVNYVVKKFFNRTETIVAKKNIFIAPTTKFAESEKDLLIKVKSLDTHEIKEFKIKLKNLNVTKRS